MICLGLVLALAACAESTVRLPDGSTHTCQHYIDGIIWWDHDASGGELDELCRMIGVNRAAK